MKTTITETFDKDGRVVKRVTVTEDEQTIAPILPAPFLPAYPYPNSPSYPQPPIITLSTPNIC